MVVSTVNDTGVATLSIPKRCFALVHQRVGAPPLTHLCGVLAKPETRSAEAGAAIVSRRDAAEGKF
jgi:hypothetical protein